jgi:cytochrome P450
MKYMDVKWVFLVDFPIFSLTLLDYQNFLTEKQNYSFKVYQKYQSQHYILQVDTFMFEGHDTTSTGITWALHMLGNHPQVQQKVYEEILTVCGSNADEEISLDQLARLRYTECCIKETLRLYPSVPLISRRLGADTKIGGAQIPEDTQVLVNIYLIHRDAKHWPNPEVFNPDRFILLFSLLPILNQQIFQFSP